MYIHQQPTWPAFTWQPERLEPLLGAVRHQERCVLGHMQELGFSLQAEALLQTLTLEALKSSEIEGEHLPSDQVRFSLARRLGLDVGGLVPAERRVEGVVDMLLDATQGFARPSPPSAWAAGRRLYFPPVVAACSASRWERGAPGPRPDASRLGAAGPRASPLRSPPAEAVAAQMAQFLTWFNADLPLDAVLKAGIAHLWFVTIHPFEDGNGRVARALTELQLARADSSAQHFYSLSAQLRLDATPTMPSWKRRSKGRSISPIG